MKKIVLIVGMVLCAAIIGSVMAVSLFNADDINGTVSSDQAIKLTIGGSSATNIDLAKGVAQTYLVELDYTKSASVPNPTMVFTVTANSAGGENNLDHVDVSFCSDQAGKVAITENVTVEGNVITLTGITAATTLYLKVALDPSATATDIQHTSGSLELSFDTVA